MAIQTATELRSLTTKAARLRKKKALVDFLQALGHLLGHLGRVVDDDPVVALRRMAEGRPDEFMELLQVGFGAAGTGEDDREGQVLVVRVH